MDIINFTNATIASILSSWVLMSMESHKERFKVNGGRPNAAADWMLGSVCGYIVVEALLLCVTSYRLRGYHWSHIRNNYGETVIFHMVALVGLTSVVFRNTGYPIALWVVWSELTSVFLGLENFIVAGKYHCYQSTYTWLMFFIRACSGILFVFQRVVMFYYLLWLSWAQFEWDVGFVFQFTLLVAGTTLNTHMATSYVRDFLSDPWYR